MIVRRWTLALLAAGLSTFQPAEGATPVGFAARARPSAGGALCSLVPTEMRLRSHGAVAFIGTAEADTVLAGAGSKQYTTGAGHLPLNTTSVCCA